MKLKYFMKGGADADSCNKCSPNPVTSSINKDPLNLVDVNIYDNSFTFEKIGSGPSSSTPRSNKTIKCLPDPSSDECTIADITCGIMKGKPIKVYKYRFNKNALENHFKNEVAGSATPNYLKDVFTFEGEYDSRNVETDIKRENFAVFKEYEPRKSDDNKFNAFENLVNKLDIYNNNHNNSNGLPNFGDNCYASAAIQYFNHIPNHFYYFYLYNDYYLDIIKHNQQKIQQIPSMLKNFNRGNFDGNLLNIQEITRVSIEKYNSYNKLIEDNISEMIAKLSSEIDSENKIINHAQLILKLSNFHTKIKGIFELYNSLDSISILTPTEIPITSLKLSNIEQIQSCNKLLLKLITSSNNKSKMINNSNLMLDSEISEYYDYNIQNGELNHRSPNLTKLYFKTEIINYISLLIDYSKPTLIQKETRLVIFNIINYLIDKELFNNISGVHMLNLIIQIYSIVLNNYEIISKSPLANDIEFIHDFEISKGVHTNNIDWVKTYFSTLFEYAINNDTTVNEKGEKIENKKGEKIGKSLRRTHCPLPDGKYLSLNRLSRQRPCNQESSDEYFGLLSDKFSIYLQINYNYIIEIFQLIFNKIFLKTNENNCYDLRTSKHDNQVLILQKYHLNTIIYRSNLINSIEEQLWRITEQEDLQLSITCTLQTGDQMQRTQLQDYFDYDSNVYDLELQEKYIDNSSLNPVNFAKEFLGDAVYNNLNFKPRLKSFFEQSTEVLNDSEQLILKEAHINYIKKNNNTLDTAPYKKYLDKPIPSKRVFKKICVRNVNCTIERIATNLYKGSRHKHLFKTKPFNIIDIDGQFYILSSCTCHPSASADGGHYYNLSRLFKIVTSDKLEQDATNEGKEYISWKKYNDRNATLISNSEMIKDISKHSFYFILIKVDKTLNGKHYHKLDHNIYYRFLGNDNSFK